MFNKERSFERGTPSTVRLRWLWPSDQTCSLIKAQVEQGFLPNCVACV